MDFYKGCEYDMNALKISLIIALIFFMFIVGFVIMLNFIYPTPIEPIIETFQTTGQEYNKAMFWTHSTVYYVDIKSYTTKRLDGNMPVIMRIEIVTKEGITYNIDTENIILYKE